MAETGDLVVVSVPGVQRFLAESRTTADVHAASALVSRLSHAMILAVPATATVVMPGLPPAAPVNPSPPVGRGLPNRIVVVAPAGSGSVVARAMAGAADDRWRTLVNALPAVLRTSDGRTPGFPAVQWAVIPDAVGDYHAQWTRAVAVLAARKRTRTFPPYQASGRPVCSLSGRWASSGTDRRTSEDLSTISHVKRAQRRGAATGFPSTLSVASAPYRQALAAAAATQPAVLAAIRDLRNQVDGLTAQVTDLSAGSSDVPGLRPPPGGDPDVAWLTATEGAWVYPQVWDPASLRRDANLPVEPPPAVCEAGRRAAADLAHLASRAGVARLSAPYLAVLVQDADTMGSRLSRSPAGVGDVASWQREVSRALVTAAEAQSRALDSDQILGRTVYAGGDDVLAFLPTATATAAAVEANRVFTTHLGAHLPTATASSAIVYFHASTPLQSVIGLAQELLKNAKTRHRPGLGVAVMRRGGERARVVLPWSMQPADATAPILALEILDRLTTALSSELSGRLASTLERDRAELASLPVEWRTREIARLTGRHGGLDDAAGLLATLVAVDDDRSAPGGRNTASDLALVARFLAAEGAAVSG